MSNTDSLALAMGARLPDSTTKTPRTLSGALLTAVLLVAVLLLATAPRAALVGLVVAALAGTVAGFVIGVRRGRRDSSGMALPGIGVQPRL